MPFFADRVKVATATAGNGTVALGAALPSFRTFAAAAVPNASIVRYLIREGLAWEIGLGTYDSALGTLTRSIAGPGCGSSTGALLVLAGAASVEITIASIDWRNACMVKKSADLTGDFTTGAGVIIAWDSEIYDDAGWHDNVTNNTRLTVPSGVDRVRYNLNVAMGATLADNAAAALTVLRNGLSTYDGMAWQTAVHLLEQASTAVRFSLASGPVPVVAGDYFEARLTVLGDASITIESTRTTFAIESV